MATFTKEEFIDIFEYAQLQMKGSTQVLDEEFSIALDDLFAEIAPDLQDYIWDTYFDDDGVLIEDEATDLYNYMPNYIKRSVDEFIDYEIETIEIYQFDDFVNTARSFNVPIVFGMTIDENISRILDAIRFEASAKIQEYINYFNIELLDELNATFTTFTDIIG